MGLLHHAGDPPDPAPAAIDEYEHGTSNGFVRSVQRSEKVSSNVPLAAPRARISTFHLIFSPATDGDGGNPRIPSVHEDHQTPGLRVPMTLIAAEYTSIFLAAAIKAISGTLWAVLWITQPLLRLLNVTFTLDRELLTANAPEAARDRCGPSITTYPSSLLHEVYEREWHAGEEGECDVGTSILAPKPGAAGTTRQALPLDPRMISAWSGKGTLEWKARALGTMSAKLMACGTHGVQRPAETSWPGWRWFMRRLT